MDFQDLSQRLLVALSSETTSGEVFFQRIVIMLGAALGVRYVFSGELLTQADGERCVRTLAVHAGGSLAPNMTYSLRDTPCDNVVGKSMCVYPRQICDLFPADDLLRQMGAESYLGVPIFDAAGKGVGILVLIDDKPFEVDASLRSLVSVFAARCGAELDRMRFEQKMQAAHAELERQVAERTLQLRLALDDLQSFNYTVSHDLKAPLRHLDGFLAMLADLPAIGADTQARELIGRSVNATHRMRELIEALMQLHALGQGRIVVEPVAMAEVVSAAMAEFTSAIAERAIVVEQTELPTVMGNRALLVNAMTNLIGNAIKYSSKQPQPRLRIEAVAQPDARVEIAVVDNGAGFDMAFADQLFKPFKRLHAASDFTGTGIGLASVKRIADRLGAEVRAVGKPGQGARFSLVLPHVG